MNKGLFFTFEGGEGSGKTTQIKMLDKWMDKRNIPHIVTKEPGSKNVAECVKFREILLNPENDIVPTSELLLFLADRAQHVEKLIKPSLDSGIHVLCDRFSDSTRVYQCARGISRAKVDMLINFATSELTPDLTFILDLPSKVGLKRARDNSIYSGGDRIEKSSEEFHDDVRYGFLKLAESIEEQNRFHVIDVAPPKKKNETHEEIVEYVSKKIFV